MEKCLKEHFKIYYEKFFEEPSLPTKSYYIAQRDGNEDKYSLI